MRSYLQREAPTPSKGFDIVGADPGIEQRWVVHPGAERFPMHHGAQAIGLADLMRLLAAV